MFCPLCGTGYDETANFCKRCGKAFTDSDKKEGHHSDLNIQQSDSGEMSTTQPLSFKAYMESRNVFKNQDASFTAIQKRKADERSHGIKKKVKKSEVVQVSQYIYMCIHIVTYFQNPDRFLIDLTCTVK